MTDVLQEKIKNRAVASYDEALCEISKRSGISVKEIQELVKELNIKNEIINVLEKEVLNGAILIDLSLKKDPLNEVYQLFTKHRDNREVISNILLNSGERYLMNNSCVEILGDIEDVLENY